MEGGRGFTTSCYFALLCLFLRTPATDYSYSESPPTTVTPSISVNLHILSKWQCSEELLILPSGPRGGHLVLEGHCFEELSTFPLELDIIRMEFLLLIHQPLKLYVVPMLN